VGLKKLIKSQLLDVIEWTDDSLDTMVYRFPMADKEIMIGAQLTVRESQTAIFVNEGQIADVFQPGRYRLETQNMPVLTLLKSWKYGFNSPFKAEVYYINTRQFIDQKWGTTQPVTVRDAEFGAVRIRAFGTYSFRVTDPVIFLKEIFGTGGSYKTEYISGQLKQYLASHFADAIGESKIPLLDLASQTLELGEVIKANLQEKFNPFGLSIKDVSIQNISGTEKLSEAIDRRSAVNAMGGTAEYTRVQTADALRDAAQNEGGGSFAGMGAGLGAGAAIGNMMGQAMNQQASQPQQAALAACPKCSSQQPAGTKFCSQCGQTMDPSRVKCIKCSADIPQTSRFCPECGTPQEMKCIKCTALLKPGVKFCPECGTKQE
jgi:membrane protease subunit (stomatin/prohibitin family)